MSKATAEPPSPPMSAGILQLPKAANSIRNYVNLDGALSLSMPKYHHSKWFMHGLRPNMTQC